MDIRTTVGLNIRKYRLSLDISQEELAARMDVDQGYVSKLEAGQRNPTITTVYTAAEALGVDVQLLFSKQLR